MGRQALVYDDERILGGLDWNVAGRYHDALKLGYANKNNEVHLILAFNQNDEKKIGGTYYASGAQPYKNMQTVWYHYKADNVPFGASLLFMNLGLETGDKATDDSHTRYLQTMVLTSLIRIVTGIWMVLSTIRWVRIKLRRKFQL